MVPFRCFRHCPLGEKLGKDALSDGLKSKHEWRRETVLPSPQGSQKVAKARGGNGWGGVGG